MALEVVVFAKADCHLCEKVEEEIRSLAGVVSKVTVIDIASDGRLHDRYWLRIPVVTVDGKEVFEAKMMDAEGMWRKRLASMLKA